MTSVGLKVLDKLLDVLEEACSDRCSALQSR